MQRVCVAVRCIGRALWLCDTRGVSCQSTLDVAASFWAQMASSPRRRIYEVGEFTSYSSVVARRSGVFVVMMPS